jgi:nucleoside-diphosphate-sugar epimerase
LAARQPELSPYAASKHAGERALSRAGGSRWTVLRPPAVYGPGDRELLRLFRWVQRGYAVRPAPAEARFSLIHVDDLVGAALSWIGADAGYGEVLEIGDDREAGYGWAEVIDALSTALDVRPRLLAPPAGVLYTLAALSAGAAWTVRRAPMLTPAKLRELRHPDWVIRDRRARRVLGWRPEVGLDEGVRQTVAWYRGQGWL